MNTILKTIKQNKALLVVAYCLLFVTIVQSQSQISFVSSYQNSSYETSVFATADFAYISSGQNLEILDLSNIQNPVSVGNVVTSGTVNGIYVVGQYAYLASNGLNIIDVSNPTAPNSIGKLLTGVESNDIEVVGDYAYLADGDGFKIINVSDPANPILTGSLGFWPSAKSVHISGSLAYVGVLWDGIKVVDISNPASPVQVGTSILTPGTYGPNAGWATDIYESDGKVYLTDGHFGMYVFELNGTNLDSIGEFTLAYASGVYVENDEVYLADGKFELLDASNVTNINVIESFTPPNGNPGSIHVLGNYIFLGIDYYGLNILERGSISTSIDQLSENDVNSINVFPNPTSGEFTVELMPAKQLSIKVCDVQGRIIFESVYDNVENGQKELVDISKFANGMYYIKLQDDSDVYTKNIIKH